MDRIEPATAPPHGPARPDEATRRPLLDGAGRRRSALRYVLLGVVGIVAVVLLATRAADRGDDVDAAIGDTSTTAGAAVS